MMNLVGIGDLFITDEYIQKGMKGLNEKNVSVSTVEWNLKDFDELQHINLLVEQGGSKDAFLNTPKLLCAGMADYFDGKFTRFLLNKQ